MSFTPSDRRRVAFATLVSLVALPALWLGQRDDASSGQPAVAVAGLDGAVATPNPDVSATQSATPAAADPAFIAPDFVAAEQPGTIGVNVQPADQIAAVSGKADYRRFVDAISPTPCMSPQAPYKALVTVRNVDNGRTTTCVNVSLAELEPGVLIVLETDVFLQLADLVDALLPVELSW